MFRWPGRLFIDIARRRSDQKDGIEVVLKFWTIKVTEEGSESFKVYIKKLIARDFAFFEKEMPDDICVVRTLKALMSMVKFLPKSIRVHHEHNYYVIAFEINFNPQ